MIKYVLLCLVLLKGVHSFSQQNQYARQIIDTLSSSNMHGRGYVNEGDKLAANYIESAFRRFHLKYFQKNYFQDFTLSVNTFPDTVQLFADSTLLIPGIDYLIHSNAPSCKGIYNLIFIDESILKDLRKLKKILRKNLRDKGVVLVQPESNDKTILERYRSAEEAINLKAGLSIHLKNKLTWSVSQTVSPLPAITILKDKLPLTIRTVRVNIENKFIPRYVSRNIVGFVEGIKKDSFIVFSAHYDHLGRMGKDTYFPGANDNASGTAMLLNLAKHFSSADSPPPYSIAFIAFAAEEAGLVGSKFYTENPLFPLQNIKFVINMDILGTGDEGITVVNATEYPREFERLLHINDTHAYLKTIKSRGKAANSDHYFFSEKGVKAFFIYTMGGIKAYHDVYDKPETLPLTEFEDLFTLFINFVTDLNPQKQ